MKKLTCCFIALLIMSVVIPANAQVRIGVIGGLNFTDVKAEVQGGTADVSSRTLFGVGGVIDLGLDQTFSLRLEPMYLQKGAGTSTLETQPGLEWKLKSTCLEIPLFLKAEFGNKMKSYLMAGPSLGILLSSDLELDLGVITLKGDAKKVTKSLDVAAAFGAGVRYPVGESSIFVEARYSLGLTNTVDGGDIDLVAGPVVEEITWEKTDSIKNRGFQVMAGVTIPLGGE
jgi:hypothetical protein